MTRSYFKTCLWYVKENDWLGDMIPHGWGNGYVSIPPGHPFHGHSYDYINEYVSVHYGLTFAARQNITGPIIAIGDNNTNHWIIGFDTGHFDDNAVTWPKEAVEAETIRLYKQVVKAGYPLLD